MALRELFSNTAETGVTEGFPTYSFSAAQPLIFRQIESLLSPDKGFSLVHKSQDYGECMFKHKYGNVTLTIIQVSAMESAIGMHIMAKKRFGFPKKWGKSIYGLIEQQFTRK